MPKIVPLDIKRFPCPNSITRVCTYCKLRNTIIRLGHIITCTACLTRWQHRSQDILVHKEEE
jgi:hypothetical protein